MSQAFRVSVPATTANIGPGFDCLGAALTRYNHFTFTPVPEPASLQIEVSGQNCDRVPTDASNLAYIAFQKFFQRLEQSVPGVHLRIELDVPLARGMGSSSTAIVGGILGANALAGEPLNPHALAELATAIEGHPDNVVPPCWGAVGWRRWTIREARLSVKSTGILTSSQFWWCLPLRFRRQKHEKCCHRFIRKRMPSTPWGTWDYYSRR